MILEIMILFVLFVLFPIWSVRSIYCANCARNLEKNPELSELQQNIALRRLMSGSYKAQSLFS